MQEKEKQPGEVYYIAEDGTEYKVSDVPAFMEITTNMFDKEEVYENCTVHVLTNTVTGEQTIEWWRNNE